MEQIASFAGASLHSFSEAINKAETQTESFLNKLCDNGGRVVKYRVQSHVTPRNLEEVRAFYYLISVVYVAGDS